jgi:hypothetical protein
MKLVFVIAVGLLLAGCDERYRYPCQDPRNWEKEICKKPFCSGNGTCPEDLSHYLKDNGKGQPSAPVIKDNKGACK